MSTPIAITLIPPTLANNYCPTGPNAYQQFANDVINGTTASVSAGNTGYNFGSTTPLAGDQDKPWLRLLNDGTPDKWYVYSGGLWLAKHPSPAASSERRLWVGIESDLVLYDGGSAAGITATTGAFWQVDHGFDFRMPLGAGTSPAPASTVVIPTGTGGEENHTTLLKEIPAHFHTLANITGASQNGNFNDTGGQWNSANGSNYMTSHYPYQYVNNTGGDPLNSNATAPHNNMPPYYGVFFIKRTARIFYTPV